MKTITLMLLLFTCVWTGFAGDDPRSAQNDDIREVVFRYQLDHARPSQKQNVEVYFLAVAKTEARVARGGFLPLPLGEKRHDPSNDLMGRFKDHKPPIHKNSALQDRPPSPKRGLRFRVTTIKWISDTEVEVSGGHDDYWSASWNTFTVRKENGKWNVTRTELKKAIVV